MKNLIFVLILFPAAAMALMTKPTYNCNNWNYKNGVYVCASYPFVEYTIDGRELTNALEQMNRRVAALEGSPSSVAFAQYPVYNCSNWAYKDGSYLCASYPFVDYEASAQDVIYFVNQLDQRIRALESEPSIRPVLSQKPVYRCTNWTYKDGYYACASYPFVSYVLDNNAAYELARIESRIARLEGP